MPIFISRILIPGKELQLSRFSMFHHESVGKIGEGTSTVGMLMLFDGDVPLFTLW